VAKIDLLHISSLHRYSSCIVKQNLNSSNFVSSLIFDEAATAENTSVVSLYIKIVQVSVNGDKHKF
jgi:hypothetical protein